MNQQCQVSEAMVQRCSEKWKFSKLEIPQVLINENKTVFFGTPSLTIFKYF